MIHWRHYGVAILTAVSLHLLAALYLSHNAQSGAQAQGDTGIEIDLGMLGDLGSANANQDSQQRPEPVVTDPEPAVKPPEPTPAPQQAEPKIQPRLQAEPEAIQVTQQPEPEPVKNSVKQAKVPAEHTATKQSSQQPAQQQDNHQAQRKQSTGRSNSLTSGGNPGAVRSYFALIQAHLAKHKRYPITSRRRGEEGVVNISFRLAANGRLLDYKILKGAGYPRLNQAVIQMLTTASPLPPFPDAISEPELTIKIPIEFRLNQ
ncbi:TonB family protein [Pontibacter sp. JAM-7]|uniref:TonB family protein n=1 Tax=Pontibacter sp. JAM-7 TaxID=3366581 RepID=UPI003AF80E08